MKRTVICLILSLLLCLGLLCGTAYAEDYYLWVGGERVTSDNAADVFGDGTVSYDSTTMTLTLNDYVYTGQGYKSSSRFCGVYWGYSSPLNIQLVGENELRLTPPDAGCGSYGVYSYSGIVFRGSGSLIARGGDTDGSGSSYGLSLDYSALECGNDFTGSVTGIGGDVNGSGSGSSYGISSYYGLSVYSGAVTGLGGSRSGDGGGASYGISCTGGSLLLYGGSVTGVGGDASTEGANTSVQSYGVYGSGSYKRFDVFDGVLTALGGKVSGASGDGEARSAGLYSPMNELPGSTYYSRSYGPGLNIYGGTVIALGGDASRANPEESTRVYSFGVTGNTVKADGGALIARAGAINGGFRMKTYDYYFYTHRAAVNTSLLLGDSVIAGAAGWSKAAGDAGFGELTVSSSHTDGANRVTGDVGGVSDYKEELGYRGSVAVEPSGLFIAPASWSEAASADAFSGDSWLVNLESESLSASDVDLGSGTLLAVDLYEGADSASAAGLYADSITGSGGRLVAVGPLLTGSGAVSSGLHASSTLEISGEAEVTAVGGSAAGSFGAYAPKGSVDLTGVSGAGRFLAAGLSSAYDAAEGVEAGDLSEVDEGSFYLAADYGVSMPAYTVTVNPGAHMTAADASGALTQTGVSDAIDPVIFTADDGYHFPTDYVNALIGSKEFASLTVTRNSDTQITVSGVPGLNISCTLPDASLLTYGLYLGGVQATGINCGDLTAAINEAAGSDAATGTASYDPGTATLTLEDFSYTGKGFEYSTNRFAALYTEGQGLNISVSGTNSLVQHSASVGDNDWSIGYYNSDGSNVAIRGSGSLLIRADAVDENKYNTYGIRMYWSGSLTIDGADVKLVAEDCKNVGRGLMFLEYGDLTVQNGGKLESYGQTSAIYYNYNDNDSEVFYGSGYYMLLGTQADGSDASMYDGPDTIYTYTLNDYPYLMIDYTDLFVFDIPVTDGNCGDLVGAANAVYPGAASGEASYDPETHTITMNGASFTNLCTGSGDTAYRGLSYIGSQPLSFVLTGDNSITARDRYNGSSMGIRSEEAALSFTGSGSLTVTGGNTTGSSGYSHGIYSNGSITVDGPALTAAGGTSEYYSRGLYTGQTATLESGSLTVTSGDATGGRDIGSSDSYSYSYGVYGDILVKGGELKVTAAAALYNSLGVYGDLTVDGGIATVTADRCRNNSYGIVDKLIVNGGEVSVSAGQGKYSYGVDGSLTVTNGTVKVAGGDADADSGYSLAVYSSCTINGGSVELISGDAYSSQVTRSSISLGEKAMVLIASPNSSGEPAVSYDPYAYDQYRYLKTGMAYNLWVGDVRVNPDNAADVLGDGKVSFDEKSVTLTLDGAAVTGTSDDMAAIKYTDDDLGALTILVKGACSVADAAAEYDYYSSRYTCVHSEQPLTVRLEDGAVLDVIGADIAYGGSNTYYTFYVNDTLTIDGPGALNVNGSRLVDSCYGTSIAVYAAKDLDLTGGAEVNIAGGDGQGSGVNYYGTRYSSRSIGLRLAYNASLGIGDGCSLTASGGDTAKAGDSSYNGDSLGFYLSGSSTLSLSGSGSAVFAGGAISGYGSYGSSGGAYFDQGYGNTVTVATSDWSGTVTFQGDTYGLGGPQSYYGSATFTRSVADCDMTGYAEIADEEGDDLPDASYSVDTLMADYRKVVLFAHRTFTVNIASGEGMTPAGTYTEEVTCTRSMAEQTYTADDGYYFPEDYAADTANGITVTRDSWTQITVAGKPTADVDVTLPNATAKEKEDASKVLFTATGYDAGTLGGLTAGAAYTVSGAAAAEFTAGGTTENIGGVAPGTLSIVMKAADANTRLDSDPAAITVTRASTPALTAVQPEVIGGKGSIPTDGTHELSTDGETWTACTGASGDLSPATYYVRVRAAGTVLASEAQTLIISEFDPTREPTPTAALTATGYDTGTLTGLTDGVAYIVSGAAAAEFTADGTTKELSGVVPGALNIVRKGNGSTTADSLPETIKVSRASVPSLTATQPGDEEGKGSIPTDGTHEFSTDGKTWTACTGAVEDLAQGTYYVRTAAYGTALTSDAQSITIAYEAYNELDDRPVSVIDSGDTIAESNLDKLIDEGTPLTVVGKDGGKAQLDPEALKGICEAADGRVKLELRDVTEEYEDVYPDSTVWELVVTSAGKEIVDYGGSVTVTIPRVPGDRENPARVTVQAGTKTGKLSPIDASYDPDTGAVTLTDKTGGPLYVVGYDPFPYTDVAKDSYYYDAVDWADLQGVTTGVTETLFDPNGEATRAQTVTFLWRAMGCPEPDGSGKPFDDVAESAYYCKAVLWAVEQGITNGTGEGCFSPNDPVTRAQTVTFLWRLAGRPEAEGSVFTDVADGSYYAEAVYWAYAKKITEGTSTKTFSPKDSCLRCQIVTFLYRYLEK